MTVKLDLDVFLEQLNQLTGIADDFSAAQGDIQQVLSDHWTSLAELNKFEGPQDKVLTDLATALNSILTSFDNLAIDLRSTFDNFVAIDEVSAEDLRNVTNELDDLDDAIDGIEPAVGPSGGLGGPYYTLA